MRRIFKAVTVTAITITMLFSIAAVAFAGNQEAEDPMYVPLRRVFEYAGANVTWDESNRLVAVEYDEDTYMFLPGSQTANRNDELYNLKYPIVMNAGKNYISYYDAAFLFEDESGHLSAAIMQAVLATMQIMDLASIPGITVALIDAENDFTWTQGFGFADIATRERVNELTLFGLASISKTFTATAVMQLVEAGKIDLDKPVVDYLPGFSTLPDFEGNGDYRKITTRMLLTHAAGIFPDLIASGVVTVNGYYGEYLDSFLDTLAKLNMMSPESTVFTYSNNSFNLLGILVAALSGYDSYFDGFVSYTQEKIFEPAGMAMTTFALEESHMPYLAQSHVDSTTRADLIYFNAIPAGGIFSNAHDMARFMHMLLSGGVIDGNQILSEEMVRQMFSAQSFDFEAAPNYLIPNMLPGLGLLYSTGLDGFTHVGHGGNLIHYHSDMAFDTDSGIGVLVSTNSITGIGVERVLSNVILQAAVFEKTGALNVPAPDLTVVPVALSAEELGKLEGIYMMVGESSFLQIAIEEDGILYISGITGVPFPLSLMPLSDGSFINPDTGLRFWFEEQYDEMVMFLGDFKTHLVGERLEPEQYLAREGFERWIGTYAFHIEKEDHLSIVSHLDVGIDANGFAYLRTYALHGQSPISPIVYIDEFTYGDDGLISFSMEDGVAWVTFFGAGFSRVS